MCSCVYDRVSVCTLPQKAVGLKIPSMGLLYVEFASSNSACLGSVWVLRVSLCLLTQQPECRKNLVLKMDGWMDFHDQLGYYWNVDCCCYQTEPFCLTCSNFPLWPLSWLLPPLRMVLELPLRWWDDRERDRFPQTFSVNWGSVTRGGAHAQSRQIAAIGRLSFLCPIGWGGEIAGPHTQRKRKRSTHTHSGS